MRAINRHINSSGQNVRAVSALSRLAWVTAALTFVLLTVGGSVHATGSSLACPDWPLCHGEVLPAMVGGVAVEHTHRLLGTAVGLCTLALAFLAWRMRARDAWLGRAGLVALGLVAVQGTLGGVTVLLRLSFIASMLHLAIGITFLSLLVATALRARRVARGESPSLAAPEGAPLRAHTMVALLAVGTQIVLGGIVRHTGSALACSTDAILCAGELLPRYAHGQIHMVHRVGAIGVILVVTAIALRVRSRSTDDVARHLALCAIALVAVQFTLGVLSVLTALSVPIVTAHLSVAALLVVVLVVLHLRLAPAVRAVPSTRAETDLGLSIS